MLGVVENMSGLRQPLASFRFKAAGPQGEERDVTAAVLAALQQSLGTQVSHNFHHLVCQRASHMSMAVFIDDQAVKLHLSHSFV